MLGNGPLRDSAKTEATALVGSHRCCPKTGLLTSSHWLVLSFIIGSSMPSKDQIHDLEVDYANRGRLHDLDC